MCVIFHSCSLSLTHSLTPLSNYFYAIHKICIGCCWYELLHQLQFDVQLCVCHYHHYHYHHQYSYCLHVIYLLNQMICIYLHWCTRLQLTKASLKRSVLQCWRITQVCFHCRMCTFNFRIVKLFNHSVGALKICEFHKNGRICFLWLWFTPAAIFCFLCFAMLIKWNDDIQVSIHSKTSQWMITSNSYGISCIFS